MSPAQAYPINHSKQVVCIARAGAFGDGEGKKAAYVPAEKNYRSTTAKTGPPSPAAGKGKRLAWGLTAYAVSKEALPRNQRKAPEMGQLLIEYNINYSMHY